MLKVASRIASALFLIGMISSGCLFAQDNELRFDQITTENIIRLKGLSQNSIYCLLRDSKGFMWIGTWDGLNKYDGYSFTVFNKENGLSNTTINSIIEDDEQNLWIGTEYGLNLLNRESGQIRQFFCEEDNPNTLSSNNITRLCQDKQGDIWIGTDSGLSRYRKDQGVFIRYNFFSQSADRATANFVNALAQDSTGMIWIGTRFGMHAYDPAREIFRQYTMVKADGSPSSYFANDVRDIAAGPDGDICVATRGGLFIIDPHKGGASRKVATGEPGNKLSSDNVYTLLRDRDSQLWVGTSEGLDLLGERYEFIRTFRAGASTVSLTNNDIRCLYQDPSGTIWIGTYRGLNKADRSPSRFTHYHHEPDKSNSLSDNIVYDILEDRQGIVWIATYDGVNLFDRRLERFSVLRHLPGDPGSLAGNKIRTLCLDSAGYVWVGTESSGVDRVDPITLRIKHYVNIPGDTGSITENNILSMMTDSRGRIWIGTGKGLNILDPVSGKNRRIDRNPGQNIQLADNLVWSLYEDRQGSFWVGTSNAMHQFSPDLSRVTLYMNDPGNPNSLSVNRVFSVYEDSDGIFWFGTAGGGLNRYDPARREFGVFLESEGLPNNFIYATLEDDDGNLWLTTNRGISKFNLKSRIFVNYDTRDGVQNSEFNIGAYYKNAKGEMYFGGMQGFNVFHPAQITINRIPPRIVITRVEVFNEPVRLDVDDGEVIRLRHTENFFAFEFAALDFTNPSKNLYRYRLENYDNDWILVNATQRRAEYRKVSPGTYRFRVTGSNNDGVWNQEGASFTIVISPPWWKSWLFRIIALVAAILLMWGGISLRIRNIRKKHDVEKKMLNIEKQLFDLEQKALRLQMNPHFIFNSLNAIQNFVLSNDTDKAVNYLAKFSHLMRMILANSIATHIPLKDELRALTYYMDLEKLRFDDRFVYEIHLDPAIDEEFIEIPPMLFQPYVENAIIHGLVNSPRPGRLEIRLDLKAKGILRCVIEDNGIGRERAAEIRSTSGIKRQPKGMIITQERLQILNRQNRTDSIVRVIDLKDGGGQPAGTRIELDIHYKEI